MSKRKRWYHLLWLLLFFCSGRLSAQRGAADPVADSLRAVYVSVIPANGQYIVSQGPLKAIFDRTGRPLTSFFSGYLRPGYKGYFISDFGRLVDSTGRFLARMQSEGGQYPARLEMTAGRYRYFNEKEQWVYDADGRLLSNSRIAESENPPALEFTRNENLSGIRDSSGRLVAPVRTDTRYSLSADGFTAWRADTAYAYDPQGRLRFRCRAHDCRQMARGRVALKVFGSWGLWDSTGRSLLPFQYPEMQGTTPDGNWLVVDNNNYIGLDGRQLDRSDYVTIEPLPGGYFLARRLSDFGSVTEDVLDAQRRPLFTSKDFREIRPIGNRYLQLRKIPWNGGADDPEVFDLRKGSLTGARIERSLAPGKYVVFSEKRGRRRVFDDEGPLDLPVFTDLWPGRFGGYFLIVRDTKNPRRFNESWTDEMVGLTSGLESQQKNPLRRYGLLDSSLKLVLPLRYRWIRPLSRSLLMALDVRDSNVYIFDSRGRELAHGPSYDQAQWKGNYFLISGSSDYLLVDTGGRLLFRSRNLPRMLRPDGGREYNDGWDRWNPSMLIYDNSSGIPGVYLPDGRQVLSGSYRAGQQQTPGVYVLQRGDSSYFLNGAGRLLYGGRGFAGTDFSTTEGYLLLLRDAAGRWGALDAAGRTIYPFCYDSAGLVKKTNDWGSQQRYYLQNREERIVLDNTGTPWQEADSLQTVSLLREQMSYHSTRMARLQLKGRPDGLYNGRLQRLADLRGSIQYDQYSDKAVLRDTQRGTTVVIDSNGAYIGPFNTFDSRFIVGRDYVLIISRKRGGDRLLTAANGRWKTETVTVTDTNRHYAFKGNSTGWYWQQLTFRFAGGGRGAVVSERVYRDAVVSGNVYRDAEADSIRIFEGALLVKHTSGWGLVGRELKLVQPATADSIYKTGEDEMLSIDSAGYKGLYYARLNAYVPPRYTAFYYPSTLQEGFVIARCADSFYLLDKNGLRLTPGLDQIRLTGNDAIRNIPAVFHGAPARVTVDSDGLVKVFPDDGPGGRKPGTRADYADAVAVEEGGRMGIYSNVLHRYQLPPVYDLVLAKDGYFVAWKYKPDKLQGVDSTLLLDEAGRLISASPGSYGEPSVYKRPARWELHKPGKDALPNTKDDRFYLVPLRNYNGPHSALAGTAAGEGVLCYNDKGGLPTVGGQHGWLIGRTGAGKRARYFLIGNDGRALTAPIYDRLEVEDGILLFRRGLRQGALDRDVREITKKEARRRQLQHTY